MSCVHSVTKGFLFCHADLKDVCERSHPRLGPEVEVRLYHPILSEWDTPTKGKISAPVNHQPFDYPISGALRKHLGRRNIISSVEAQLRDCCAEPQLKSNPAAIAVFPVKGSEWISDWHQRCDHALTSSLGAYAEVPIDVPSDVTQEVYQFLMPAIQHTEVTVEKIDRNQHILIGRKEDVPALKSELDRIIKDKHYATEDIKLPPAQLVYINVCLRRVLSSLHPQVTFSANLQKGTLQMSGTASDMEEFINQAQRAEYGTKEVRLPQLALQLLASYEGTGILQKHILDNHIGYFFASEDGSISVSDLVPVEAIHLVGEPGLEISGVADRLSVAIAVDSVNTTEEFFKTVVQSQAWHDMRRTLQQKYCPLQILPDESQRKLQLACLAEHMEDVKSDLVQFHIRQCHKVEAILLHQGRAEYLQKYCLEWTHLQQEMSGQSIQYSLELIGDNVEMRLYGETTPVISMAKKVHKCINAIVFREKHVTVPMAVKHLQSEAGTYQLKGIAGSSRATVQVVARSKSPSYAPSPFCSLDSPLHQEICVGTVLEGGMTVSIMLGDLTKYHVDVIVNAANENLHHDGGLARHLLETGGSIIQFASSQYVAAQGQVRKGQAVLMNAVGSLPCEAIVHAVGPTWNGGRDNEEWWIRKTVLASLEKAGCYATVAFPAMGTGEFGVPARVSAQGMLDGIVQFARKNPRSSIEKVTIMLYQEEHIEPFVAKAATSLRDIMIKDQRFRNYTPRKVAAAGNKGDAEVAKLPRRPSEVSRTATILKAIDVKKGSLREQEVSMARQYVS